MYRTFRSVFLCSAIAVSAFLVGCAGPAPNYAPSVDNVEALKKVGGSPIKVGTIGITAGMPGANSLNLRANTMVSPVGAHYGEYVAAALRQELELAKLHSPQSNTEVTGTLLKNIVNAGGISTADGQMEARFIVKTDDQLRFDKVKRVEHQWESSFAGAVAIPQAANAYPIMVQKLVNSLVSDPDFIKAIRN